VDQSELEALSQLTGAKRGIGIGWAGFFLTIKRSVVKQNRSQVTGELFWALKKKPLFSKRYAVFFGFVHCSIFNMQILRQFYLYPKRKHRERNSGTDM